MIEKPIELKSSVRSSAIVAGLVAAWLPVLALASAALVFTIMLISMLFPSAAFADAAFAPEANTPAVVVVEDLNGGEVTYESGLPYNRDTAGAFTDQRNTLAQTASQSPVKAGSAIGLAALAIAALAWAAMLLNQAQKEPITG